MDDIIQEAFDEARKELSEMNLIAGPETVYTAIPVPSLAFRYLLQYEGFPLGCFHIITGAKASCKSLFAVEIGKWHIGQNGAIVYLDTEGGSAPTIRMFPDTSHVVTITSESIEAWVAQLKTCIMSIRKRIEKRPEMSVPVCYIVDSIYGVTSADNIEKFTDNNDLAVGFPIEARKISAFLRQRTALFGSHPFTFIGTNHAKKKITPTGLTIEYLPGGEALQYHSHFQFKMYKIGHPATTPFGYSVDVDIQTEKNRLGPEGLKIQVPVQFHDRGGWTEVVFDWYAATTRLLTKAPSVDIRAREKFLNSIRPVVNIEIKNAGRYGTRYYCKELGISESDAMSETEMGQVIEQSPILKDLYQALRIKPATFFSPGNQAEEKEEEKRPRRRARTASGDQDEKE